MIGGSFMFALNDLRLTLINRSSDAHCVASRVQWLFEGRIRTAEMTITSPPSWTSHGLLCTDGVGVCGVEWRAADTGVLQGRDLPGFGLRYNPSSSPRPKSWVVFVGRRQVEMPIGSVGSHIGPVDD